jgi:tyrosine-protein phosphatase YwqE
MSVFGSLFKKKNPQLEDALSFAPIVADMHSHLLPGIDDGSVDMENSIELISALRSMGYQKLITTPHIFWDMYKNTTEIIREKEALVNAELMLRGIDVQLEAAAEYYVDEHFEELIAKNDILSFGDKYVLFELSFDTEQINYKRAVFNLQLNGYKPILAHPERYEYWHSNFSKYEDIADRGILIQINTNCLTGHYGPGVKRISERLIEADLVDFIGTDTHHVGHLNLLEAMRHSPLLKKLIESGRLLNSKL